MIITLTLIIHLLLWRRSFFISDTLFFGVGGWVIILKFLLIFKILVNFWLLIVFDLSVLNGIFELGVERFGHARLFFPTFILLI